MEMKDRLSVKVYGPDGTEVRHYVGIGAAGFEGNSLWALVDGKRYQMTGTAVAYVIPYTAPSPFERMSISYNQDFVLYGGGGEELLNLSGVCASILYGLQNVWSVHCDREDGGRYIVVGGTVVVTNPLADARAEACKKEYSVP